MNSPGTLQAIRDTMWLPEYEDQGRGVYVHCGAAHYRALKASGVRHLYGLPGDSVNEFTDYERSTTSAEATV